MNSETMALDVKISFSWVNYCRLCLVDDGIMLPLFEGEGLNRQLSHKIETCLQLVTYDGDPLPTKICHKCLYKINQTYEFRTMALSSYERLKKHLLPLAYVPEVQRYLEKSDHFQKTMDFSTVQSSQCSTPSVVPKDDVPRSHQNKIRIKTEDELVGKPTSSTSGSQDSNAQLSIAQDSLLLSSSFISTPISLDSTPFRESTPEQGDSLKRKRTCNADMCNENNTSPVSKIQKKKKQLAGPASRKKSWRCALCESDFKTKASLMVHQEDCVKCRICDVEFNSLADKAIHEAEKHISVHIDCEKKHLRKRCSCCPARFASKVMLSTHLKTEHTIPLKVENNEPQVVKALNSGMVGDALHMSSSASDQNSWMSNEFPCPNNHFCQFCEEPFPGAEVLVEHLKIVHGKFKCRHCDVIFSNQNALNGHAKSHNFRGKHPSSKKPKEASGSILKQKLLSSKTEKRASFSCHTCYDEFETEDSFVLHLYKHAIEQSDDETMPKKKSRKVSGLSKKKVVSVCSPKVAENPEHYSMKCDRCHVVCRSKEYFKIHMATHMSKVKTSFPCSGCNQDFRNVEALNRHTCRCKVEDLQICCLDCGQGLVEHEEHICDNKCPACDKVFKSSRGQRLHFLSKHKSNNTVEDSDEEKEMEYDTNLTDQEDLNRHSEDSEGENGSESPHSKQGEDDEQSDVSDGNDPSPIQHQTVIKSAWVSEPEAKSFVEEDELKERLPPDGAPLEEGPYPSYSAQEINDPPITCHNSDNEKTTTQTMKVLLSS